MTQIDNKFQLFDHLGNKHPIQKKTASNQSQNAREEKATVITSLKLKLPYSRGTEITETTRNASMPPPHS
jgi:hypothetical protein